nr:TonB-dependent receptor [Pyrinomonadaceae bacterium]
MILLVPLGHAQGEAASVKVGKIVDIRGNVVPNARIRVVRPSNIGMICSAEREAEVLCDFSRVSAVTIEISAIGFVAARFDVGVGISAVVQPFVLSEVNIREEVVVTANRDETRVADTPLSISVLGRKQIETSGAAMIDDTLRQSAGFSTFRRTGSRNSNPTTQGVSLRGVGSSGASRSLVLFDGVPLNDPFGGWVQWAKVPSKVVENVEVLRGGASSYYGDASLSGAVHLRPRAPEDDVDLSAEIFGGSQQTASAGVYAGIERGGWLADISASHFQTRGFIPVDVDQQGPVDTYAGSRNLAFMGKVSRRFARIGNIFVRPSYFGEVRSNGTGLQTNRTHSRQLVVGGDVDEIANRFRFQWRAFGGTQVYDQAFSAVNSTRSLETLTRVQRSPAKNLAVSGQITSYLGKHTIIAGVESRAVHGSSDELIYSNGSASGKVGSGGREVAVGVFGQGLFWIGTRVVFGVGAR